MVKIHLQIHSPLISSLKMPTFVINTYTRKSVISDQVHIIVSLRDTCENALE